MAIIFTSPKKKQRIFFRATLALLILLLFIVSFVLFSPMFENKLQNFPGEAAYAKPEIKIDFNIMDSDKVKNLEPFESVTIDFDYTAQDKNGKQFGGQVSAFSKDAAKNFLEQQGLNIISLAEVKLGRAEPFAPY